MAVFEPTSIPGVVIVVAKSIEDDRGLLMETMKRSEFARAGIRADFVQENHTLSKAGTLRGLHYQRPPRAQGKLVRVVRGEVFDVAVDLRPESPTFRRWVGVALSAENRRSIYIPPECAHGFCVVSSEAEVVYKMTEEYSPEHEVGIRWDDPAIGIAWPVSAPALSPRDRNWPPLLPV